MKLNQNQLKELFEDNFDFQARTKKGYLKDTLYRGMFSDTLYQFDINKGILRDAVRGGLLEQVYVKPGNDLRAGYIYIGEEIGRNKVKQYFKNLWSKIKNLI